MFRRTIKQLKRIDDAYIIAREAGFSRREAVKIASHRSSRDAFIKLTHVPGEIGGVIVDVGANRGQLIEIAMQRFRPQKIVGIEPLPGAFAELQKKWGENPAVRLFQCAAGATNKPVELQVSHHDQASSVLPIRTDDDLLFDQRDVSLSHVIRVEQRRLDDILREAGIGQIDLLVLDVQGYELEVLRGAEDSLQNTETIMLEVSFYPQYETQSLFWNVHNYLHEKGFVLRWLGDYQTTSDGVILQADAVYVNRDR
ncbi:MAG: FkbM family methyltransferase [Anaerolineae bacterium]|nr:FkbM family methyltransferase [Anaerolineae bacterium]